MRHWPHTGIGKRSERILPNRRGMEGRDPNRGLASECPRFDAAVGSAGPIDGPDGSGNVIPQTGYAPRLVTRQTQVARESGLAFAKHVNHLTAHPTWPRGHTFRSRPHG